MGFAVAYMMIADSIVQSIIKERQTKVKHQIMVSGASKLAYWASNFFVDFLYHLFIAQIARLSIHLSSINAPDIEEVFFVSCPRMAPAVAVDPLHGVCVVRKRFNSGRRWMGPGLVGWM